MRNLPLLVLGILCVVLAILNYAVFFAGYGTWVNIAGGTCAACGAVVTLCTYAAGRDR